MTICITLFLWLSNLFFIGSVFAAKKKFYDAINKNEVDAVRELLTQDSTLANELLIPSEKLSPLHLAVMGGNVDIVALLLDKKPKIDAQNKLGMTPLHYAVQENHTDVVKLLLAKGADKNVKSKLNETPLSIAKFEKHNDIIALLADDTLTTVPVEHPPAASTATPTEIKSTPAEEPDSKKIVETNNNLQKKLSTIKNKLEQLNSKMINLKQKLHDLRNVLKTKI